MSAGLNKDELILQQMGYKQELKRSWSSFRNFCLCFSTMSILSGLTPLYGTALITGKQTALVSCVQRSNPLISSATMHDLTKFWFSLLTGGPVVIIFGWIFVTLMTFSVALSMAEVCSAYPTSGGLYYWSAAISKPKYKPVLSFFTGWFNLIGQLAGTAAVAFGLALVIVATISIGTDGTWVPTPGATVGVYIAILVLVGLLNTYATRSLGMMNVVSMYWHIIGILIIIISLLVCTRHSPASPQFVFTDFENHTGWSNNGFVVLLGLLQSQYSFTGYDSAAHMTEETQNAQRGGPISILGAILATSILGLAFLLAVTFSIQDYDRVINSSTIPIAQVFLDALGKTGAILVMCIIIVGVFFCANAGATSNARLIYALSRDGALPFSGTLHKLDPKTQSPVIAVWALLFVGAILGLPYLGSATAFVAITSVCTISLYITYGLPTLCLLFTRDSFVPGPFNLGRFSQLNGIIAVSWITFISVLFILPTEYPVDATNMNYAIAIFGALWIVVAVYWVARGRYVFKGPIRNVESTTSSLHSVELEKPSPVLEADVSKEKSVATEVV